MKFRTIRGSFYIVPNIAADYNTRNSDTLQFYYTINEDTKETTFARNVSIQWKASIKKLTIFVDISGVRDTIVSPFKRMNRKSLENCLKELWKDDSSVKFTLKCGNKSFDTFKPFLATKSFFFKDLFESGITENFVEITDFEGKIVKKMVEFCETDNVKVYKGCEDKLFIIAHKFQVPDLMDFAVEKMSENADSTY